MRLTGGQFHGQEMEVLLEVMTESAASGRQEYDSTAIRELIVSKNACTNVPSRSNRIKRCHSIATRYDNDLAHVKLI